MDEFTRKINKSNDYHINLDQLKSVGELIKQARNQNMISIESLSEVLHIDKSRLISLENGEKENLPENVFIVGMIRQIARVLKIDSNQLINQLLANTTSIDETI